MSVYSEANERLANGGIALWLEAARPVAAVAELGSLGILI